MSWPLRRVGVGLAVTALLLTATSCGDDDGDYCGALTSNQTLFAEDGTGQELITKISNLADLAEKAPDDLADEWQVFLGALEALDGAIKDAGLDAADIVGGVRPAGVSDEEWTAIKSAADALAAAGVADALSGIDQQAKDVCKVQLGL